MSRRNRAERERGAADGPRARVRCSVSAVLFGLFATLSAARAESQEPAQEPVRGPAVEAAPSTPSREAEPADGTQPDTGRLDDTAPETEGTSTRVAEAPASVPDPGPSARATALLAAAEEAITGLDYTRSRSLAERAIARGQLGIEDLTRAYRLIAVTSAQLDQGKPAERAFLRLFALEPNSNIASRLSPTRRSAMLNARGFWSVRQNAFGLEASYVRRERQISIRTKDPIGWVHNLHVWSRFGDREYTKVSRPAATDVVIDVRGIAPNESLEVYAFATDEYDNVVMQIGSAGAPQVFAPTEEELRAFLRRDIRGGQTGSFARRLEELGVDVGVHGYASLEFKPVEQVKSFDLHHATAMIRANLQRAASLELAFEWEHLGRSQGDFYMPHAFVDLTFSEFFVVRAGFFEVPVGAFNEYLYPDFLRTTGLPPHFSRSVVPALWSEVGLQLRGRMSLGSPAYLTYAAFVGNGLEQADDMPTDGVLAEGGDLRGMRFNDRDAHHDDKAVGGRLGLELGEFDVGISGYTGRYTIERARRLTIADVDASYRGEFLTIRAEAALADQEVTGDDLQKYGLYLLVAGRPWSYVEPYAQYDYIDLGLHTQRVLAGVALYPFPHERATSNLRLKSEAGFDFVEDQESSFVWFFQLTTGF